MDQIDKERTCGTVLRLQNQLAVSNEVSKSEGKLLSPMEKTGFGVQNRAKSPKDLRVEAKDCGNFFAFGEDFPI